MDVAGLNLNVAVLSYEASATTLLETLNTMAMVDVANGMMISCEVSTEVF
jgi:hypothetical protein